MLITEASKAFMMVNVSLKQDSITRYEDELSGQDNIIQLNVKRHQGDNSRVVVRWMASGDHNGIFDINPLDGTVS